MSTPKLPPATCAACQHPAKSHYTGIEHFRCHWRGCSCVEPVPGFDIYGSREQTS